MEADPVLFDRFRREAEIGKIMDHPGVMKVLDNEPRSQVYMVMEWVDGRNFCETLSRTEAQASAGPRARIAINILHALEHIHSRGVAHRDLKPENVMVDIGIGLS